MRLFYWIAGCVFVLDQATKYYVVHMMDLRLVGRIDVFPPYLNLRMAWNTGINFGLMSGDAALTRWILIAVALLISGVILWWVHREPLTGCRDLPRVFAGRALGNVVDRLIYGAVADFLNMSCCGIDNPYAFNVADIAVFAGAIGLVLAPGAKNPS